MITRTNAFVTSDNETHATLEQAQARELELLAEASNLDATGLAREQFCDWAVANADKVVDILTTKANSKPRARKINGGTKKRNNAAVTANTEAPRETH